MEVDEQKIYWDLPTWSLRGPTVESVEKFSVHIGEKDWLEQAIRIFRWNGFVLLRKALSRDLADALWQHCQQLQPGLRWRFPNGNRGDGRISFAVASKIGSLLHHSTWVSILKCEELLKMIKAVMPDGGYCVSGGGDFVFEACSKYQKIHSDLPSVHAPFDRAFPPPFVCANVVVHPISYDNGPMRIIPGTQEMAQWARRSRRHLPTQCDEPENWRRSVLAPLEPGDIIVRDVRTLHGGTPNKSTATRFLPSVEFASFQFLRSEQYTWPCSPSLPQDAYDELPWEAQDLCNKIVAPRETIDTDWRESVNNISLEPVLE